MAKVLVEVPDDLINWTEWARRQLDQGGLASSEMVGAATGSGESAASADTSQTSPSTGSDDPWQGTNAAPAAQNGQGDPWGGASAPTGSGTNGQQPVEAPAQPMTYGTLVITGQKGNRTCTFGKQGAPPCNHGQPAVFTEFSSGKKNWACALSATKRWKEKCEFTQWA